MPGRAGACSPCCSGPSPGWPCAAALAATARAPPACGASRRPAPHAAWPWPGAPATGRRGAMLARACLGCSQDGLPGCHPEILRLQSMLHGTRVAHAAGQPVLPPCQATAECWWRQCASPGTGVAACRAHRSAWRQSWPCYLYTHQCGRLQLCQLSIRQGLQCQHLPCRRHRSQKRRIALPEDGVAVQLLQQAKGCLSQAVAPMQGQAGSSRDAGQLIACCKCVAGHSATFAGSAWPLNAEMHLQQVEGTIPGAEASDR